MEEDGQGGYKCPRSETGSELNGSELNPGRLPPPPDPLGWGAAAPQTPRICGEANYEATTTTKQSNTQTLQRRENRAQR